MATIIYSKNSATLEDISNFEKIIKGNLPNDYKDFLMKYNGGQPQPNSFIFFLIEMMDLWLINFLV